MLKQQSSICFYNREWTSLILVVRSVRMTLNRLLISFSSILWQEQSGTLLVGGVRAEEVNLNDPKDIIKLILDPPLNPPTLQMSFGLYL